MSVNNEISTSGPYAGNGSTTAFSITFTIQQRSQVVVYKSDVDGVITTLVQDTDYSVTGFPSAGIVSMAVAPAVGEKLLFVSNYQETQLTEFESQGGFFPDVHENAFDKLTYLIQQINRNTLQLPVSFTRTDNSLPTPRNGFGFRWDENDNLVEADLTFALTTDDIITFESVLQMKAFAPTTGQIGQLVNCKRYYTEGELVEGLDYEIVASATVDGFIDHAVVGAFAILTRKNSINIKQAGAVGDGSTNDALALQAAFDSPYPEIKPDSSTYLTLQALTISSPKIVRGLGKIKTTNAAIKILEITSSDVTIEGISFEGVSDAFVSGAMGVSVTGVNNSPAAPTYIENVKILSCKFANLGEYGVLFSYSKNCKALGNKVDTVGYGGICGISCEDLEISSNTIKNITQGSPLDAYGIFVDRLELNTEVANPRSFRVNICNNFIENITCSGNNGQGIDTHGGVDFVISNNILNDVQKGIFITSSNVSGVAALGAFNISITGNVIKKTVQDGESIFVGGAIIGSSVIEYTERVVVANNVVVGGGVAATVTTGSVTLQGTKGVRVSNNNISNASPNGVYLNFNNLDFDVSSNTIKNPYDDVSGIVACVYADGDNQRGYIGGNTFVFDDATLGTNVALQCMRIDNQSGLDIQLGKSFFNGIDATHLQLVQLATSGVDVTGLSQTNGTQIVSLTNIGSVVQAVTFPKRFPSIPNITLTREGTPIPGTVTKAPILETSSVTATGFNIIARPYDLTTFGGAGDITVNYKAEL